MLQLSMYLANVAQLVRASGCGSEGRGFNPHYSPQEIIEKGFPGSLFCLIFIHRDYIVEAAHEKQAAEASLNSDGVRP